jgi:hypothetical protein
MPAKPGGDALHLPLASYHKCDFLVTWNCLYLANANEFGHIRVVNTMLGLFVPALVTPLELLVELLGGKDEPAGEASNGGDAGPCMFSSVVNGSSLCRSSASAPPCAPYPGSLALLDPRVRSAAGAATFTPPAGAMLLPRLLGAVPEPPVSG